jgi:hypothetical protein
MTNEKRPYRAALVVLAACLSSACAISPRQQIEPSIAGLGAAATAISDQATLALREANKTARDASIDRFIASRLPGLTDEQFVTVIGADEVAAWQQSLGLLESYASTLESLIDEGRGVETTATLKNLGQQILTSKAGQALGGANSPIAQSATGFFASLAGKLINAQAQRSARAIMLETDPDIKGLIATMADAIGASDREGLRGTVFAAQTASLNGLRADYARAAVAGAAGQQRQLINEYFARRAAADLQLQSLARVRGSLLRLGEAHAAAAQGRRLDLLARVKDIAGNLEDVKALIAAAGGPKL